jgi:glycosyltransferase involved in cell wall biosynthesis
MHALFFTYVWPEPVSSAAGVRTLELMESLLAAGWQVSALSPCKENPFRTALVKRGILCYEQGPNHSEADALLRKLNPDIAVFDRFVMEEQFGWRLRELCPRAAIVVDTQDLHFVRRARERAHKAGVSPEKILRFEDLDGGEDLIRELSSLHRSDLSLVVSLWEKELLKKYGISNSEWMPLFARIDQENPVDREGFCFLGNFRHPPNLDGALWLARELWPDVYKQEKASLHFYGAYPPAEISALHGKNGIQVHGPVPDHRAALRKHSALIAPLRFGAGIKGKVLEAWCCSTPVIGTPIAFEGMGGSIGLEFQNAKEFLAAIKRLPQEKELGAAGREHATALFSGHAERLVRLMEELPPSLPVRRAQNLTGRLLTHAQTNATKYFSRWIELKESRS